MTANIEIRTIESNPRHPNGRLLFSQVVDNGMRLILEQGSEAENILYNIGFLFEKTDCCHTNLRLRHPNQFEIDGNSVSIQIGRLSTLIQLFREGSVLRCRDTNCTVTVRHSN